MMCTHVPNPSPWVSANVTEAILKTNSRGIKVGKHVFVKIIFQFAYGIPRVHLLLLKVKIIRTSFNGFDFSMVLLIREDVWNNTDSAKE